MLRFGVVWYAREVLSRVNGIIAIREETLICEDLFVGYVKPR